jgi:hypothetical protein
LWALREKVAEKSESEAYRLIKVWRAMWKRLVALGYDIDIDADPSKGFPNPEPKARDEEWPYRDVLKLVQRAWRKGYYGLAALIAVACDTMLSPVDVRKRTPDKWAHDAQGSLFVVVRAKTGQEAIGTLTQWSEAIIEAYLIKLDQALGGIELHPHTPLFWSRGFVPGAKGGRPRASRPYTKDQLSKDFAKIRAQVFGANDPRQLQDMRRTGAGEVISGDATPTKLSAKMANTIGSSNKLFRTYVTIQLAAVREADEARLRGREKNKTAQKVARMVEKKLPGANLKDLKVVK